MKKIIVLSLVIATLMTLMSVLPTFAAEQKSYDAKYGKATVDGVVSEGEWDGVDLESLDIFLSKDAGSAVKVNDVKTRSFGTIEFGVMHDDDTLYLLVEVIDDQIVTYKDYVNSNLAGVKRSFRFDVLFIGIGQYGATGLGDNASVFVAFPYNDISDYSGYAVYNEDQGIYTNGVKTAEVLEKANEEGTLVCRRGSYDPEKIDYVCGTSDVTVEETQATKCVMEFAIPLADLGITDAEQLILDFVYHDTKFDNGTTVKDSNRRENILAWSAIGSNGDTTKGTGVGDVGNTGNIGEWGTVTLAEKPEEKPDEPSVPTNPEVPPVTGDAALYLTIVAIVSLMGSALLITKRRKV